MKSTAPKLDNTWLGDKPGLPPLPVEKSVTGDNNWRTSHLYGDTAPVPVPVLFDKEPKTVAETQLPIIQFHADLTSRKFANLAE